MEISHIFNEPQDQGQVHLDIEDIHNSLRSVMWRSAGVRRHAVGLQEAHEQVDRWNHYIQRHQFATVAGWELQNLLRVAWTIVQAALERTESRGVHFRSDFPVTNDPAWLGHLCFQGENISFEPSQQE